MLLNLYCIFARKFFHTLFTLYCLLIFQSVAMAEGTISGQIRDNSTKAPIPFAKIFISGCAEVEAFKDGAYIVDCPAGSEFYIEARANGYQEKQIGPIIIENGSFINQNFFLDRQLNQQADSNQNYQANENQLFSQEIEEPPVQQAEPLSEKASYFANLFANIAADRVKERRASKKQNSPNQGVDCGYLINSGDAQAIYDNFCDDCTAIVNSGNLDLINTFGCPNDPAANNGTTPMDGGATTGVNCQEIIKSGDAQAVYDNFCDDCTAIVNSGNLDLINTFGCPNNPTANNGTIPMEGGASTSVNCDEMINSGDAQAIYDNYCDDCSEIIKSGNQDLIDIFECAANSNNGTLTATGTSSGDISNNPESTDKPAGISTSRPITETLQSTTRVLVPTVTRENTLTSRLPTDSTLSSTPKIAPRVLDNNLSYNLNRSPSISNNKSIVSISPGGSAVRLLLTGTQLNSLTGVLIITPDGIKTSAISTWLDKITSSSGRYVYLKGDDIAKIGDGYYRLVALAGTKSFTLNQDLVRIIVKARSVMGIPKTNRILK